MVVNGPSGRGKLVPGRGPKQRSPEVRVLIWSVMAASVVWTLIYQIAQQGGKIPEFVYANF
jgi:hypothetical protein